MPKIDPNLAHVCIASKEPLANYLAIMREADRRPALVHLLASEAMRRPAAENLAASLEHLGCRTQLHALKDEAFSDIQQSMRALRETLDREEPDSRLVVNLTGGTKLMSMALFVAFTNDARAEIVYTDTGNRVFEWMKPERREPIGQLLDVKRYLAAYNTKVIVNREGQEQLVKEPTKAMRARARLTRRLATGDRPKDFLTALNAAAKKAGDHVKDKRIPFSEQVVAFKGKTDDHEPWLQDLEQAGLIRRTDDRHLVFTNKTAHTWCHGGWMEEFALLEVADLPPASSPWDFAGNVRIRVAGGARNEFDLMAVHDNRMMFVECKSIYTQYNSARIDDALYKIGGLRNEIGGPFSKAVVLSAEPFRDADRKRAQQLGITVFAGPKALPDFRTFVADWVAGREGR